LITLFLNSLFISAVTFGGGSQPLFEDIAVHRFHWINLTDFSALLAFGYATPGPAVFGTATFIGYRLAGLGGALVGSLGVFLIPWMLALVAARYLGFLSGNRHMRYFGQGVGLAAAGLLISTAWSIARQSSYGLGAILICACAGYAAYRKVNPLFILLAGLLIGLILK